MQVCLNVHTDDDGGGEGGSSFIIRVAFHTLMDDICPSCFSSLKSKELSPVIGHKAIQVAGPTVPGSSSPQSSSQSPHSTEHSPHTLRKGRTLFAVKLYFHSTMCY